MPTSALTSPSLKTGTPQRLFAPVGSPRATGMRAAGMRYDVARDG